MGKSWKNTMISANAAKKGAKFTKFAREIQVAAKLGGPDPESNSRLRIAIAAAKAESCPNDTIDRAIRKGAGLEEGLIIEEVTYEGMGPHQVGLMIECQTDNRNRTASSLRGMFNKAKCEMTPVAWMFDRIALVEGKPKGGKVEDPEAEAIEAGANDVYSNEDGTYAFTGAPEDLKNIEGVLRDRGWEITNSAMSYQPKNPVELTEAQKKDVLDFMHTLDDDDDVSKVFPAAEF
jgi:YebC/PmpR family DNA-binding regulatory protein